MNNGEITFKDLQEVCEKLQEMPPTPTLIEVHHTGLEIFKRNIENTKMYSKFELEKLNTFCGIRVVAVDVGDFNINECKVHFSDGHTEIKKIFNKIPWTMKYKQFCSKKQESKLLGNNTDTIIIDDCYGGCND